MKIKVYAKLNLTLNVTSLEENGYHNLDMVNQSISIFDEIELTQRDDKLCKVYCDRDIGIINTALTSASQFVKRFDCCGYDVKIKKGIPMMGGLGGSSADAAGILTALAKLHDADMQQVYEIADVVGSDVRYMMTGGLARVTGRGNCVQPVYSDAMLYFVLVLPPFGMSTQRVYHGFDEQPDFNFADNDKIIDAVLKEDTAFIRQNIYNGLQATAFAADGRLKEIFDKVSKICPVQMTGSGSCLFAVADSKADSRFLAERLKNSGFNAIAVESKNFGVEYIEK